MDSDPAKRAIQCILDAKNIVAIIGAGVSVAAGIPAFRRPDGTYNTLDFELPRGRSIKDIMSSDIKKHTDILQAHCKFVTSLAKKAASAKPTTFHHLMRVLDEKKKLRRLYTQNIDGLESKVGFELLRDSQSACCIPLHGSLFGLRCAICSSIRPLEDFFSLLEAGTLPTCNRKRQSERLRSQSCDGSLYPDILLYEEETPNGEFFASVANQDAKKLASTKSSVLLVVGTTLQIPGVVDMIKVMKMAIEKKGGFAIYVDLNPTPPSALLSTFDLCVKVDCQTFAETMIDTLKKRSTEEVPVSSTAIYSQFAERRRDPRPLWAWI